MKSSSKGIPYNVKKYHYEDCMQIRVYDKTLYHGYSAEKEAKNDDEEIIETVAEREEKERKSKESSKNRTIQSIYAITRANKWEYFLTLTFDRKKINSSDYSLVTQKASQWLKNIKKRIAPNMKYIIVPELHADGEHWHLHGLLADCDGLKMYETDIVKNGKIIYNLTNWKYGFSTVTKVEHTGKVSRYITKYITKELCNMTKNRRRYWTSKNCLRADDVLEIDMLTADEIENYMRKIANNIQHIKTQSCVQSGQRVQYIEVGDYNEKSRKQEF